MKSVPLTIFNRKAGNRAAGRVKCGSASDSPRFSKNQIIQNVYAILNFDLFLDPTPATNWEWGREINQNSKETTN